MFSFSGEGDTDNCKAEKKSVERLGTHAKNEGDSNTSPASNDATSAGREDSNGRRRNVDMSEGNGQLSDVKVIVENDLELTSETCKDFEVISFVSSGNSTQPVASESVPRVCYPVMFSKSYNKLSCGIRFDHMYAKLLDDEVKQTTKLVNHACLDCDKNFTTLRSLREHEKLHKEETFICEICGRAFTNRHKLTHHVVVHSESSSVSNAGRATGTPRH